jgi:uncharacterized lipoprotein YajG
MTNIRRILFSMLMSLVMVQCAAPQLVLKDRELVPAKDASERTQVWAAQTFSISQVEDQRQRPEYWVGTAGTGVRNKPTPVELERPVATVVKTQMENELTQRGLKLASPADVDLKIKVQELEVRETREGMAPEASICNAKMEVAVEPRGKSKAKPFKWTGKVEFQNRGTLIDTTAATAATLAGCLNLMVEKMITNGEFKQTMTR